MPMDVVTRRSRARKHAPSSFLAPGHQVVAIHSLYYLIGTLVTQPTLPPPSLVRRPALDALTGLRFPAALMVVCFHFGAWLLQAIGSPALSRLVGTGYSGVTLFFVLSGFILAYTYRGADGAMTASARTFWRARFARVYPVYALGLVAAVTLGLPVTLAAGADPGLFVATILLSAGFLQNWVSGMALSGNAPGWSTDNFVEAVYQSLRATPPPPANAPRGRT